MTWRTRVIAVGFVAALLLAGVLVPRVPGLLYVHRIPFERLRYEWVWNPEHHVAGEGSLGVLTLWTERDITLWWLVALEELVIVLGGGLALTWSIRRDRRARGSSESTVES